MSSDVWTFYGVKGNMPRAASAGARVIANIRVPYVECVERERERERERKREREIDSFSIIYLRPASNIPQN